MIRFVFLADTQLGAYATFSGMDERQIADFRSRGMRVEAVPLVDGFEWDASRYQSAIAMINAVRPDFVIIGGDMIDDGSSQDQLEELLRITKRLDPTIPMRWAPGNHDIAPDTIVPTRHSIDKYRETFGADYYAFGGGDTRFIVLNTVVLDQPQHVPGMLEEQFAFLEFELERASEVEHIVMFGHHPLFLESADEPDTYWNNSASGDRSASMRRTKTEVICRNSASQSSCPTSMRSATAGGTYSRSERSTSGDKCGATDGGG